MSQNQLLTDLIPGLREAIDQERLDRMIGFLGLNEELCGIEVRPLTTLDIIRLYAIGSPFVCGGTYGATDVLAFLKLQRANGNGFKAWRRWKWFNRNLGRRIPIAQAGQNIQEFISEAHADSPGGSGVDTTEYWTVANDRIHVFGSNYGWSSADTLNLPLKILFTQLNLILRVNNPGRPLFNPRSDKVRGQWLLKQNKGNN